MHDFNKPDDFNNLHEVQKQYLLDFCYSLEKTQSFNMMHNSYSLKHKYEKLYRDKLAQHNSTSSISNGQFKGAMLKAGFKVKDETRLNWNFNVNKKSIKELEVKHPNPYHN